MGSGVRVLLKEPQDKDEVGLQMAIAGLGIGTYIRVIEDILGSVITGGCNSEQKEK